MSDGSADIIFFRIPLCGKCKQVEANLARVIKDRPSPRVGVYTLPSHIVLARSHGLLSVPAMIISGRPYRGTLSSEGMLSALDTPR